MTIIEDILNFLSTAGLTLLDFLVISLLSTTALLIIKGIEEFMGHYGKRFSMYVDDGVLYGVLSDIAIFFPLMAILDFFVIWIFPYLVLLTGINLVWITAGVVVILSFIGMNCDMIECGIGKWKVGEYPVAMVYFNWQVDFWAWGAVLFFFLGGWILWNVIMALIFIVTVIIAFIGIKTGLDKSARDLYSCPFSEW